MDKSEECTVRVKQESPTHDYFGGEECGPIPADVRLLDQFCRLCLRTSSDLIPVVSYLQGFTISQVFQSITGLELILEDTFPNNVCRACLVSLEKAYTIRQRFVESYRMLETLNRSKSRSLIDQLYDHQNGTSSNKQPISVGSDIVPCVSIPIEATDEIKREPELDLDPEELPESEPTSDSLTKESAQKRVNKRYNQKIKRAKLDPNKCYICETMHEDPKSVEAHLPEHVGMIPYHCEQCTKESGRPVNVISLLLLHRHFRMHASAIKCEKCPFRTCTMAALYGHMKIFHGENSETEYTCELCGVKLINEITLGRHMRFHKARDDGRYSCSHCDKNFATKPHLTRHERSHTNERPFKCRYCPKSYKEDNVLHRHERTHTGEKGFHCEICGKRYRLRSVLNTHMVSAHGEPKKEPEGPATVLTCDFEGCNYSTSKKGALYNHRAIHEPKFQCAHCPKKFPTGQRLEIHQFVHTGVKKFQCNQCSKGFLSKHTLEEHMAAHNDPNPLPCDICGKIFTRERSLKAHRLKHTDLTKNFECGNCDKKFKYRGELARHEKTHEKSASHTELPIRTGNPNQELPIVTQTSINKGPANY